MKYQVSVRSQAADDIRQARDWYDAHRAGLGEEFVISIAEAMLKLEQGAHRFPTYYRGFSRLIMDRFPYKIFFRIEDQYIIVFRVLHAARDHVSELTDS